MKIALWFTAVFLFVLSLLSLLNNYLGHGQCWLNSTIGMLFLFAGCALIWLDFYLENKEVNDDVEESSEG